MAAIEVFITGEIVNQSRFNPIPDNCIKFYEGFYEISIAINDRVKSDIRIFKKNLAIKNDCYSTDCTNEFFKSEFEKFGMVYYSHSKLIKALKLAKKLSN